MADNGGQVADITIGSNGVTVTIVGPDDGSVNTLIDAVQTNYPGCEVLSFRSESSPRSGTGVFDSLTEKQRRALEVAFYNGYFERPREHDTTEVASKLGITRQTMTQHLRAGQQKVFERLFDSAENS